MPTKMEIYKKNLIAEFNRQFKFLIELVNNRATHRTGSHGDFIDKVSSLFKSTKSFIIGVAGVFIPGMGAVDRIISSGTDWMNLKRKELKLKNLQVLDIDTDSKKLKILLDDLAHEASRRYEFVINQLSDNPHEGIIPLVQTQVARMLNYLIRKQLPLTEKNLLQGIIEGHSGRFRTGFSNHHLKLKSRPQARVLAENVCGKAAFAVIENDQPQLWISTKHQYKLENGFIIVPKSVAEESGYEPIDKLNKETGKIYEEILHFKPSIQMVLRKDVDDYIKFIHSDPKQQDISFKKFIVDKKQNTNLQEVILAPEDEKDLDFSNLKLNHANFSHCRLNKIKVRGDISGSKFKGSYLREADFNGVDAQNTNFKKAHLEQLQASQANFSNSNLEEAQLNYGNFEKANFENTKTLASKWTGANLKGCKTGTFFKQNKDKPQLTQNEEAYRYTKP